MFIVKQIPNGDLLQGTQTVLKQNDGNISGSKYTQINNNNNTLLMILFPGLPRWANTLKVKPIWILPKQDIEWQWHQLGRMEICTSPKTDNHASIPSLNFLQEGPSCQPTNSVGWLSKHWRQNTLRLKRIYFKQNRSAFSALTLLVGWQEGHLACKN